MTGDDGLCLAALLALAAPGQREQRYAWMHRENWADDPPLVHLDLHCVEEAGLTESWVLPAPDAALVAANCGLRLAVAPDHDALTGKLNVDGPLFVYDGYVEFAPGDGGAEPSAWAWDLDPHSLSGGWKLRSDFSGICDDMRNRLRRRTGPVLIEPRAGKVLTVTEELHRLGWVEPDLDVDPDEPPPDRVGVRVEALIDGDRCVDVWDGAPPNRAEPLPS